MPTTRDREAVTEFPRPAAGMPVAAGHLQRLRVLIVDDEPHNVRLLRRILERAGYTELCATSYPREVRELVHTYRPDLVLLDLHMPEVDGFGVLNELRPYTGGETYLPVLMLTGDASPAVRQRALASGAKDFLTKPFDATDVLLRIRNLLETRFLYRVLRSENQLLEASVQARTRELEAARFEILDRLADAAEFRDNDTHEHTQRVAATSAAIAEELGMDAEAVELIRAAAPLHDVGKIAIPDRILLKPGPLTTDEFEVMKTHTTKGAQLLAGGASPLMRTAERIALSHHERWDGQGYPEGRSGEAIPLEARIVAVADVFDALSHDRPYRPAWHRAAVLEEIERLSGVQFDPAVVRAWRRRCADGA